MRRESRNPIRPRRHALHWVLPLVAWLPALGILASVPTEPVPETPPSVRPFSFIAIGCMPYARLPDADANYGRVLDEIDRHAPVFAVHLGDILGGEELCTDELLARRLREFDSVATALVFTPGDNEWTDVHRTQKHQPLERLARIREVFFAAESSRGARPIPLITQRRSPRHARFVENARWTHGRVVFVTLHVVGSGNNHQPAVPGALDEWRERDEANVAWLREGFAVARATEAAGVALFFQANPIRGHPGFRRFLETLAAESVAFGKPVLLVHADDHKYRLEPGFRPVEDGPPTPKLTLLGTFGASDFHGVQVTVDPSSEAVFLPGPLLVPGNPLPRLPRPAPSAPGTPNVPKQPKP
ncbi:MAG: hypothetical protein AB7O66_23060 [Limisphaerales bacterium]